MPEEIGLVILVLLGVGAVVLAIAWHFSRSQSLLERWARDNGYRVTVEDSQGNRRGGWVRCGGWLLGLWSDNVEVRWEG